MNCIWLLFSTILKNISQWEGLSHILWKIENVPNHQPVYVYIYICTTNMGLETSHRDLHLQTKLDPWWSKDLDATAHAVPRNRDPNTWRTNSGKITYPHEALMFHKNGYIFLSTSCPANHQNMVYQFLLRFLTRSSPVHVWFFGEETALYKKKTKPARASPSLGPPPLLSRPGARPALRRQRCL